MFIVLGEQKEKTYTGAIIGFSKREITNQEGQKVFYPAIEFESGDTLLLFHHTLKGLIGEALKKESLKVGDVISIKQGNKIEGKINSYYEYHLLINDVVFISGTVLLSKEEMMDELFN